MVQFQDVLLQHEDEREVSDATKNALTTLLDNVTERMELYGHAHNLSDTSLNRVSDDNVEFFKLVMWKFGSIWRLKLKMPVPPKSHYAKTRVAAVTFLPWTRMG